MAEKKKKKKKSSAPSGLGTSRSVNKFTFSWKGHDYEKQKFAWGKKISDKKFSFSEKPSVGKASSKVITLNRSDYYPYKVTHVETFIADGVKNSFKVEKTVKNVVYVKIDGTETYSYTREEGKRTFVLNSVPLNNSNIEIKYDSGYKPKLEYLKFRIKGTTKDNDKYNYTESKEVTSDAFKITAPLPPTSVTHDQQSAYTGLFTVVIGDHINNRNRWGTKVLYETCILYGINREPINDEWGKSQYGGQADSWEIRNMTTETDQTEFYCVVDDTSRQSEIVASGSAVRWFRACVAGPGGSSKWVVSHFAYGDADGAKDVTASLMRNGSMADSYICKVNWSMTQDVTNPIDYAIIEYSISDINSDLTPKNPSWSTAEIGGDNTITPAEIKTKSTVTAQISWKEQETGDINVSNVPLSRNQRQNYDFKDLPFYINSPIDDDKVVFVRITTFHNGKSNPGEPIIAENDGLYFLAAPDQGVYGEGTGNVLIVSANNNCNVNNAFIEVSLITWEEKTVTSPTGNVESYKLPVYTTYGVIDLDGSTGSVSKSIAIPPEYFGSDRPDYGVRLRTCIGNYHAGEPIGVAPNTYNIYSVSSTLCSRVYEIGAMPRPPAKPIIDNLTEGNVRVGWNWNWDSAISAEIAWSDYALALESNEQPSSYVVSNSNISSLVIRNLATGIKWYFWVRLLDETSTSGWSEVASIDLTSAPNIPELSSSKTWYRLDEDLYLSWVYVSTDGTQQASAQIAWLIDAGDAIVETSTADGSKTSFEVGANVDSVVSVKINDTETSAYTRSGKIFTFNTAPTVGDTIKITYISDETYYKVIKRVPDDNQNATDQFASISISELGWEAGKEYKLVLKVMSESGLESEQWSDPIKITIPAKVSCSIIREGDGAYSFVPNPDTESDAVILDRMPLTFSVTGGEAEGMTTSITIERRENYFVERPDGGMYGGYEGEIVYSTTEPSGTDFEIQQSDISGYLDDTASYILTATVKDGYGQPAEDTVPFIVDWEHQAVMPNATITTDHELGYSVISILDPVDDEGEPIPDYPGANDVCDIYRHSIDGYELVYKDATFNSTYVDPYPTIGMNGGHRIVYRTANGDYIIGKNQTNFAYLDILPDDDDNDDIFKSDHNIINFGAETLDARFNVDLSSSWKKDFQKTRYLGGSIEGDWNAGVERTGSMNVSYMTSDISEIEKLRELAEYEGYCRVRSTEGSNYVGDIQVSENVPYAPYYTPDNSGWTKLASYSFNIEKVDSPTKTLIPLGGDNPEGYDINDQEGETEE